jgi:hypothetical protein
MTDRTEQPLLILGMHRSGTSYLARLMQALGMFIGDDLVGPKKGNPRGHFEAVPMLEFHQKLIAARIDGSRRAFDDGMLVQEPLAAGYSEEETAEAESLIATLRRPGPWGWKEPRTCLFLDLWKSLLPDAQAVIVYRHPLEVHQSLLRREHWDLALFPDQAMRAYAIYNQAILNQAFPAAFCFNANTGFSDVPVLAGRLGEIFGLQAAGPLPEFHAEEFQSLRVSSALHRLTGLICPEAVAAFDALQDRADVPFDWQSRPDDAQLDRIHDQLAPIVADLPPEARACLGPLLDGWATGEADKVLDLYGRLAEEIGGRVQRVEQWNREAAEIFKENERLSADYERMGREYAKQQEFLAKQAQTQAKVWEELTRTGDSWKEQRTLIENLLKEKRALLEEIRELRNPESWDNETVS